MHKVAKVAQAAGNMRAGHMLRPLLASSSSSRGRGHVNMTMLPGQLLQRRGDATRSRKSSNSRQRRKQ